MKKLSKRLLALLLSLLLVCGTVPPSVLADDLSEAEAYRQGVFERYDRYIEDAAYDYTHLTALSNYTYTRWADEVESKGTVSKVILWATHKLTGKELDTDAYTEYLMKILAMQEKGLLDTLAAQAHYTAKATELEKLCEVGSATISMILDAQIIEEIASGFKAAKSTVDFFDVAGDRLLTTQQAILLTCYGKSYEQKLAFLTAVRDNTDDKHLKEAAEDLIHTTSLQIGYLFMNDAHEITNLIGGFSLQMSGYQELSDFLTGSVDKIGKHIADCFDPKSPNFTGTLGKLSIKPGSLSQKTLHIFGLGASYCSAIVAGFKIGGALGAAFWGDDIELFREMKALDEISAALAKSLNSHVMAANTGYTEENYNSIRDVVAVGQALTYAHLRGEYCSVESIRGKPTAPDNLDLIYNYTVSNLSAYYNALATIFPPELQQVFVDSNIDVMKTPHFLSRIADPVIYLPGREEIAAKINSSASLQHSRTQAQSTRASYEAEGREYASYVGYPYEYNLDIDDIYSTPGALSMWYTEYMCMGSAHPNSIYFTKNYDLKTGEILSLNTILDPDNPNARQDLIDLFIADLSKELSPDWAFVTPQDAIHSVFSGETRSDSGDDIWGFTRSGLQIVFSPYAIAPYAAGAFVTSVPYTDLDGIIHPDYLPESREGMITDGYPALYTADTEDLQSYTKTYGTPAEYAFAADGKLCDIYVGLDNGSDHYPGAHCILFYASSITAGDLLWLGSAAKDPVFVDFTLYSQNHPEGVPTQIRLFSDGTVQDTSRQN